MTDDEMKAKAIELVKADNPDGKDFKAGRVFYNILEGTLMTVDFTASTGRQDSNQVHFGRKQVRVYRWMGDVMNVVSTSRERIWFFRFIELAGMGGVIAFILVLIFSALLSVLALGGLKPDDKIFEIVKLAFTLILGYFFGSQSNQRAQS